MSAPTPLVSLHNLRAETAVRNTQSHRILLIEDNGIYVNLVREMLLGAKGKSFVLEWANRLQAGLERLAEGGIDLVLLDLSLPDSSGLETFTRAHALAPHVPIIVLTGLDDETVAVQTVRDGAQDYLVKTEVGIQSLLHSISYAIERNRLKEKLASVSEELRARNQEMEADLEMAQELQQVLLSHNQQAFPQTADAAGNALRFHYRYQPTSVLAGDFFDVMVLSDTMVGVLIADVMGHGVRAALVTAIVRGLVEDPTLAAFDPGQFLTEINRRLTAILCNNEWPIPVSAFYLVADIATGRLCYANAGHPHPIYMHRDSGIAELLAPPDIDRPGPILGVINDVVYSTQECRMAPFDFVMLYTDGLYEAEDRANECFGRPRLMAAVSDRMGQPASQMFDGLLTDVRQFTGSEEFSDDVCIVGMEVVRVGAWNAPDRAVMAGV